MVSQSRSDRPPTSPSPLKLAFLRTKRLEGRCPLNTARRPRSIRARTVVFSRNATRLASRRRLSGSSTVVFIWVNVSCYPYIWARDLTSGGTTEVHVGDSGDRHLIPIPSQKF